MKKLIIVLLFSITSLLYSQEVVAIGDYELTIPADYEELKAAYIDMTGLYLDSEADLEKSIENFDDLKIEYDNVVLLYQESEEDVKRLSEEIIDRLNPIIIDLEESNIDLSKELKTWMKPDPFGLYGGLTVSNELIPNWKVGVFANLVLFEQFSIQVEYRFPDEYSFGIGYKLF